jgi:XTP/dITP diphosphohydrolase
VKLLVATRSRGKQREAQRLLESSGIEIVFPDQAGVGISSEEELLELHPTFEGNARAKAEYFHRRTGLPTVADDSGLEVFALGGEPGVRSKRWAGQDGPDHVVEKANNEFLLRRLLGAPPLKRKARYRCVLALVRGGKLLPEIFEGTCSGTIAEAPSGTGGFGYDPLFLSDELGMTFGEAAPDAKDNVSHRGRAFAQLRAAILEPREPGE